MREILFRGKRKDNSKWVEGSLVSYRKCNSAAILASKTVAFVPIGSTVFCSDSFFEIDVETVGQYTGLTDKSGTKIFEGDYIVCRQAIQGNFIDEHIEMGYVEMKHGAFGLHRKQGYYRPFKDWLENYEYEVIGNIHDNPELLKGGA